MKAQQFVAQVEARPRGGVAIRLPFDPSTVWGDKERHYVKGSIERRTLRGTLTANESGVYYLQLGPAWCRDRPLTPGEAVTVELEPEGPQLDSMTPDIAAALRAEPAARRVFESLATFYRNGYVDWVEGANRPKTRMRRIQEAVNALKAGRQSR